MTDTDYTNGLGVFSEALVPFTGELAALLEKRTPINVCSLARLFPENFCSFLNQKCDALLPKFISQGLAAFSSEAAGGKFGEIVQSVWALGELLLHLSHGLLRTQGTRHLAS